MWFFWHTDIWGGDRIIRDRDATFGDDGDLTFGDSVLGNSPKSIQSKIAYSLPWYSKAAGTIQRRKCKRLDGSDPEFF
jgi:hypothetical protein